MFNTQCLPLVLFSRFSLCVLSLWSLCLWGSFSSVRAASPVLGAIQPRGAQRGTEAVLTFAGARLTDAQEVLVSYPGITVKKLDVVNDGTLKVAVAIGPDCRLGEHAFRVRTATGVSDLRTFWVGALPVVEEVEPNSDFEKPQPIALNVTVHGVVQTEDVDYFAVECKKGQRLSVEIEAMRLSGTFFDPYVAILDGKRFELATGDDSPLTGQDGGCSVVVPADGKYIIQVRESAYGGNGACQYRLHVGTFPRPTAVVPAGGKPGEELEVTFLGDPAGPIKQKVKLPAAADEHWRLHCQTGDGIHPAGFKFRVADLPNTIGSGANVSVATATAGSAPGAFNGVVAKAGETSYFKFAAKKGETFDAHCYARRVGSPLDPVLYLGNSAGGVIAANDDSNGPDSYFRFTVPADGEYTLWVHDHLRKGGPDYFFRIELTPVRPLVTTTIPKADGNNPTNQERQTVTVPRGGRAATLVIANRADCGGALTIGAGKLPAGVTLTAEQMEPGLNVIPVVFDAKPDAAVGGNLTGITATSADPKVQIPSKMELDPAFVIGQPGQTVYTRHVTDRTVIAVGEAAPYSIDVVEPKVPLVQNGSFNLRVVAKRAEGFKGPITVFPLWTPPGLGIQGSAVIPEGQTECVLPMNAAPNAAPRKWKTVVHAVADAGKGPVWTSSQLFALEVVAPIVAITMERPAVEQGQSTQLFCKVVVGAPFEGKAKVTLIGLPAKATSQVIEITKETKEFAFPISADKTSPTGQHNVFAQVVIERSGELITGNTGGTQLRIDVPLPPKVAATPTPITPTPTPAPMNPTTPEKRLTRLEQLRKEAEEREKAAAGGAQPPPKKDEPKKP
jgi:hypothetical protein